MSLQRQLDTLRNSAVASGNHAVVARTLAVTLEDMRILQERRRDGVADTVWRTFIGEQSFTRIGPVTDLFLEDVAARFGGEMMEIYQGKLWSNGLVRIGDTGHVYHAWCIATEDGDRKPAIRRAITEGLDVPDYVMDHLNR